MKYSSRFHIQSPNLLIRYKFINIQLMQYTPLIFQIVKKQDIIFIKIPSFINSFLFMLNEYSFAILLAVLKKNLRFEKNKYRISCWKVGVQTSDPIKL